MFRQGPAPDLAKIMPSSMVARFCCAPFRERKIFRAATYISIYAHQSCSKAATLAPLPGRTENVQNDACFGRIREDLGSSLGIALAKPNAR